VQQNQWTQGHGQGYLGQLKGLTPELVKDVEILNGPFSAEYGDFSGLGSCTCGSRNPFRTGSRRAFRRGRLTATARFSPLVPIRRKTIRLSPTRDRARTGTSDIQSAIGTTTPLATPHCT